MSISVSGSVRQWISRGLLILVNAHRRCCRYRSECPSHQRFLRRSLFLRQPQSPGRLIQLGFEQFSYFEGRDERASLLNKRMDMAAAQGGAVSQH